PLATPGMIAGDTRFLPADLTSPEPGPAPMGVDLEKKSAAELIHGRGPTTSAGTPPGYPDHPGEANTANAPQALPPLSGSGAETLQMVPAAPQIPSAPSGGAPGGANPTSPPAWTLPQSSANSGPEQR